MTLSDNFVTHRRDDRINQARWLSGVVDDTDRLRAFVEVLDLLGGARATSPHWTGTPVVVDRDGDRWDLRSDGLYESRTGLVMSASHIEAAYAPVKPISFLTEEVDQ